MIVSINRPKLSSKEGFGPFLNRKYDETYTGAIKWEPSYIRLPPEKVRIKISLMCRYIREYGVEGLEDYEWYLTWKLNKGVHESSELYPYQGTPSPNSCTPPKGFYAYSSPLPSVDLERAKWSSKDIPLFNLTNRWLLATDYECQWIIYHRRGTQWKAVVFPTSTETLLRLIRDNIPKGINPEVLAEIKSWPDTVSNTVYGEIHGAFRHWLALQKAKP